MVGPISRVSAVLVTLLIGEVTCYARAWHLPCRAWHLSCRAEETWLHAVPTYSRAFPSCSAKETEATKPATAAVASLAATMLALLAGDEEAAANLAGGAAQKGETIQSAFAAYDACGSGTLSYEEAQALFTNLARSIVSEIAYPTHTLGQKTKGVARAGAKRIIDDDDKRGTIKRVATKLLLLADVDGDGKIDLQEFAGLFDAVQRAQKPDTTETFPQPLRALAGSLQLLPPSEGTAVADVERATEWHVGVPGDDHTLKRVQLGRGLSVVGLGRSADASAYFVPELGLVLDAGIHVKSLQPKCVLLTHGHRDHTAALPAMAQGGTKVFAPAPIAALVRRFLLAEAQLNYGDEAQSDEETVSALGDFDVQPVEDLEEILLPRTCYTGSPTPIGVQVFKAPHKGGVPAVSYGVYRAKTRLRAEYAELPKNELGALLRDDVPITEAYSEGVLFYTGDTTIELLRGRWSEILPKYRHIIHEVTFFGPPSDELDAAATRKGHTHYAQLHPFICSFPQTTFICVHWSLRYSKEEVLGFFNDEYGGVPKNVVLWL